MRLRALLLIGMLFVSATAALEAQQVVARNVRGLPFAVPTGSKERAIRALSNNERVTSQGGVLYVDADKMAAAALPRFGLTMTRPEFVTWFSGLTVRRCPQGVQYRLDWVSNGEIVLDGNGEVRYFRQNEMCLYDGDELVMSLDCLNFVRGPVEAPLPPARAGITAPPVVARQPPTIPAFVSGEIDVNVSGEIQEEREPIIITSPDRGIDLGWLKWPMIGLGVIGGSCVALVAFTDEACLTINVAGAKARARAGSGSP